jgi:non-specific serine/threonine protein kinase
VFRLGEVWVLCERCVAAGDAAAADGLYTLLAGFAARHGGDPAGFWPGTASLYLGLLAATAGRVDVAAAHLEEASRAAASAGAAVALARTQLAYARVLVARGAAGDAARAERLLSDLLGSVQGAAAAPPAGLPPLRGYVFRREGEYWTLASPGRLARVRGRRGFDYIAELLRRPHRGVYVVELMSPGGTTALTSREVDAHGLHVVAAARSDSDLDRRARRDYRARWRELLADLDEAERDHDPGRAAAVQHELDMLARELTTGRRAGGIGGASAQERARVNVRNCVSAALRAVRRHDEPLWRHLTNTIKTGTYCVYEPDRAIDWEL